MDDNYQDLFNIYVALPSLGVLTEAALRGDAPCIEALLRLGANVNEVDFTGDTPLIQAIVNGHENVVKILIKCGVDVNQRDEDGEVPLLAALQYKRPGILQDLLDAGADISVLRSDHGKSILKEVAGRKDQEATEMLAALTPLPERAEPDLFNGEKLADVFDSSKWTGRIEKMQQAWEEVPAPLKETFDFETALVEARRQTLLARAPKAPVLKISRSLQTNF